MAVPTRRSRTRASIEIPAGESLHVSGGLAALEQLFLNLMLNAAQALRAGGAMRVTAVRCDEIEVSIADDGCGMTPAELAHIERPYRSSRKDGTGLGLKIARRVLASHGGKMDVRSEAGVGTTVSARLSSSARAE
jgi:signal transduction histidine kinase